ncbi:MAG: glutaminase [Candidatus Marinimicrobia bacterium]|nr:glutaminase [Candidatus Neomarinimicrobiota bacterium]
MYYTKVFEKIYNEISQIPNNGIVCDYIPELGNVNPNKFGVHLITVDRQEHSFGDSEERFSIQSIAKVLSLTLAYNLENENLWRRVGVEPSGTPFNSLVQLESDNGIPRNPLINAGAIVICDVLLSHIKNPKEELLHFIHKVADNPTIVYSPKIAESEKLAGFRNRALVNLMKSYGNIHNDIDKVMDFYFHLCSIEMNCRELARTFLYLATDLIDPETNQKFVTTSKAKRLNAIMQLCGFYDEAGEFSFRVGLPGKSGVGGGIVALHPGKYSIAVWSPRLNKKGNSFLGIEFLERFTTEIETSIF